MNNGAVLGLMLTLLAGLATGIGGAIAFFVKRSNKKILALSLGFSGGVMIYISLVELLASAQGQLIEAMGSLKGGVCAGIAFFGGIALAALIDRLIPEYENPHEVQGVEAMNEPIAPGKVYRSGIMFAIALAIHNFPEGMAVFASGVAAPETGIAIAVAVAIHNIPEGITVSVPLFHATGSRKKAFIYSFISGLAEPAGALIAWLILMPFMSVTLMSVIFAAVAGIMVYISFDELMPMAEKYGEHHLAIYGLIAGMLVMNISLLFL